RRGLLWLRRFLLGRVLFRVRRRRFLLLRRFLLFRVRGVFRVRRRGFLLLRRFLLFRLGGLGLGGVGLGSLRRLGRRRRGVDDHPPQRCALSWHDLRLSVNLQEQVGPGGITVRAHLRVDLARSSVMVGLHGHAFWLH